MTPISINTLKVIIGEVDYAKTSIYGRHYMVDTYSDDDVHRKYNSNFFFFYPMDTKEEVINFKYDECNPQLDEWKRLHITDEFGNEWICVLFSKYHLEHLIDSE